MIAAIILAISVGLLAQFVLHAWRAALYRVAQAPISNEVLDAAGLPAISTEAFPIVMSLHSACPAAGQQDRTMWSLRLYYRLVQVLRHAGGKHLSRWADRELAACARYAAVTLERRMRRSQDWWAEAASY